MQRNLAHAVEKILERLGVERDVDTVYVFAAQRRVHDDRRQGMLDGIAGDSVDAGGGIDLVDAIDAAEVARTDLAGRGLRLGADGSEGERAAGAHAEHAADDALLAHT